MPPPSDLSEKDIPFLLEQLQAANKALSKAESTIEKLKSESSEISADERDEIYLEMETLQDRVTMTEEGLTFFFREYARLKRILEKNKIADPEHALIRAAENGQLQIVGLLLDADVDINVRDRTNGTALIAASYCGHAETVIELLQHKPKLNLQDDGGHTALLFACDKGHMEICTALVNAGSNLDIQDTHGNNGLIMASYIGHIDVCHLLVEKGVQINIKNKDGRTPLMMSCYPPEVETRYLNAKTDICELLIGAGANVNDTNLSNNTALHIASKYGHHDECEMLLKAGADINARNDEGKMPVDVATDEKTRALLRKGNDNNYPPLPSNVKTSSPKKVQSEKTAARRSSMKMIKSVFGVGGKPKEKEKEVEKDEQIVDDVHNLYGSSDRINDRKHQIYSTTGGQTQRQRYAFVHENALAKGVATSPTNKLKDKLNINKLSKQNSTNAERGGSQTMSVGEKNALNFSNMTKRNSLDERISSGNIAANSRDSMSEARERRRRQSSGASGDMARQLEELRRKASKGRLEDAKV